MSDLSTRIEKIQDPEAKRQVLIAAEFLNRLDPSPQNASELVSLIASTQSFADGMNACGFITAHGDVLGFDPKNLASDIVEALSLTENPRNRELLFRCLNEGVFVWARNRVEVADRIADRIADEVSKDLIRASADDVAVTSRTQQEHLTFYTALTALALCGMHSRTLATRKIPFPADSCPKPPREVMELFHENWRNERFTNLTQSGNSIQRLDSTRLWVMQSQQLRQISS